MTALLKKGCLFLLLILPSLPVLAQEILMGQQARVTTCGGFFLDSGGQNGNYSANENATLTICSDNTTGSHVQLVFPNTRLATGDELCFYDGPDAAAPQLQCARDFNAGAPFIIQATAANTSGCLTVTFRSNGSIQDQGWSAAINCVPACQLIQSELVAADPAVSPADTGWIDVCVGQPITLRARGLYPQDGITYQHSDATSRFSWSFGDGTVAEGPEVSYAYRRSGGYVVQLTITDQRGCTSTNFISQRVRVSTQPDFTLGGDLPAQICAGDTVALNAVVNRKDTTRVISAVPTTGSFQFGGFRSDSLALPDGTGAAYETSIEFQDFLPGQTLSNINDLQGVCLNIEHSWVRDLQISLSCPDGRSVLLHDFRGQSGGSTFLGEPNDNDDRQIRPGKGYDYCWTPDATRPNWLDYVNDNRPRTLPAGDYQSVEPLSRLVGCPLNGEWTIKVEDLWGQDNGFIFSWGINFNPQLFPDLETFTPTIVDYSWEPAPATLFRSPDSLAAAPVNAGVPSYVFAVTDDFGCRYDTTVSVTVLPPTHPDCSDCGENLGPVRDTAICAGETAELDVTTRRDLTQNVTFETFPRYRFGFANHPPTRTYAAPLAINSIAPATLTDPLTQIESVCVNIESGRTGDLSLFLRAPGGALLELSSGNGGDGDNYQQTCFSPAATTAVTAGTAPFTGSFRPEGDWSVFNNSTIAGEWALLVADAAGPDDSNTLLSWSITFRSTNAVSYRWTPANTLSCADCPNPVARPAATTHYRIEATDRYGCVSTDTLTVGVATDAVPPPVQCTVSDEGEITFFWIPGAATDRYESRLTRQREMAPWQAVGPDINSLVITDARRREEITLELRHFLGADPVNCEFEVTQATCAYQPCDFEMALAGPPQAVSCFGDNDGAVSVRVTGGDPPYTFSLDEGGAEQATGDFAGLTGGAHFVVARDTGLCTDTLHFEVPQPEALTVTPEQVVRGCFGLRANQANAVVTGGTRPYRFQWSDGQLTAAAVNLDSLNYSVSVTDANGCATSASILLRDLPTFNPNIIQSSPQCYGFSDGRLGVNFIEGEGVSDNPNDYTYRWSTGDTGLTVDNLPGGLSYTVTVTDGNGCSVTVSRLLRQPAQIEFDLVKEELLCAGQSTGAVTVTNIRGDNSRFTFQWNAAAGNQNGPRATGLTAGTYSVTVSDEDGCSVSRSVSLVQPPPVRLSIKQQDNLCFGDEKGRAEIDVAGGVPPYTFRWSSGASGSRVENLRSGDYILSLTDGNGCLTRDTVTIRQPPLLQATLSGTAPNCAGYRDGTITIDAGGGTMPYLYSLNNKDFSGADMLVGLKEGNYQVYVRDANGCLFTDRIRLEDPPEFSVDAGPDRTIILGDSLMLTPFSRNGEGEVAYRWGAPYEGTLSCTDCPTPLARTINTITYELTGIDARGCEDNDFITIHVDKPRVVEVPTGFSPNDDGQNDRLLVHGRRGTRVLAFRIFDRWGELLFENGGFEVNDPTGGWDGTFRGQPLNNGVYLWFVEVEYLDGARDVMKGQTTLVR